MSNLNKHIINPNNPSINRDLPISVKSNTPLASREKLDIQWGEIPKRLFITFFVFVVLVIFIKSSMLYNQDFDIKTQNILNLLQNIKYISYKIPNVEGDALNSVLTFTLNIILSVVNGISFVSQFIYGIISL